MTIVEIRTEILKILRLRQESNEGLGMVAPDEMESLGDKLESGGRREWLAAAFQLEQLGLISRDMFTTLGLKWGDAES